MAAVQNWGETPFDVLIDALKRGGAFPRPEIPLNAEELDGFAAKLAREPDTLYLQFLPAIDVRKRLVALLLKQVLPQGCFLRAGNWEG